MTDVRLMSSCLERFYMMNCESKEQSILLQVNLAQKIYANFHTDNLNLEHRTCLITVVT